jgi:FAD/FMN-containing dehydrogenase
LKQLLRLGQASPRVEEQEEMMNENIPVELFRKSVAGEVLMSGNASFDETRRIWNARLEKTPQLIVRCQNSSDVAASVNIARDQKIPFSVRSGGHSYAGLGVCEGGLMIDLSEMNSVEIDAEGKKAYSGPGATWGKFHEAAIAEGLATVGGTVTSVGVAGFTLGGGSGWLSRKHGLALDNLLSVEVVTADGKIIQASKSENADLFWGIRGGAGNFGIVTRFEFQLHETPSEMLAGQIIYPFKDAMKVFKVYRKVMPDTPDEFACYSAMIRIPAIPAFPEHLHGQVAIDLVLAYAGEISLGEAVVQPLRKISEPILDTVGPMSYMDVQRSFDAGTPKGQRWYSQAQYLPRLSDQAIETCLKNTENMPGQFTFVYFGLEDGAICRVDPSATAFPHRNGAYGFHILAGWSDSAEDSAIMEWARMFNKEMAEFSNGGVYVNLLAEDEPERLGAAYGSNYNRLIELKHKWDPENLFRRNQNIAPS